SSSISLPSRPRPRLLSRWASRGIFEAADHCQPEFGRARSVDHAVVERDRDCPGLADDDLAVADDRPGADPPDPEDRDFRVVDDRGVEEAGELAGARDRE